MLHDVGLTRCCSFLVKPRIGKLFQPTLCRRATDPARVRCGLSDAPEETMITANSVEQIYEYNYWARDRQLEAC